MWNDDDVTAMESWHEANSDYCSECGERWLREQMTDRLGRLCCPDCTSELRRLSPVQLAGLDEAKRLRAEQQDVQVALCSHELLQRQRLQVLERARTQTQVGR